MRKTPGAFFSGHFAMSRDVTPHKCHRHTLQSEKPPWQKITFKLPTEDRRSHLLGLQNETWPSITFSHYKDSKCTHNDTNGCQGQ